MNNPELSVVIPVYNEVDNVTNLYNELANVLKFIGRPFEIIFVNDGSTDGTKEKLQNLHLIKAIHLEKNLGQTIALKKGIQSATGKIIITLDGDGQNDPKDIPHLLDVLATGYDAVTGLRHNRQDPAYKKSLSKIAFLARKIFLGDTIQDSACTLKAVKKECFEQLDIEVSTHRMIPIALRWLGYRVTEIPVNHRKRLYGESKYGFGRIFTTPFQAIRLWYKIKNKR